MLVLVSSNTFALGIIHRKGTDIDYNHYIVSLIPEQYIDEIDVIDFDYIKGNNKYCGYYSFFYNLGNNRQYRNKITIWCKHEIYLYHELGHHIEQKTYNVINLNESYANNYMNLMMVI